MKLYPLKFTPILKEIIWGGTKLKQNYNKQTDSNAIGESWEISDVQNNISVISNGELKGTNLKDLLKTSAKEIMGEKVAARFGTDFPLLIKLIDAKDNLSVQVHPDDKLAKERHDSFGKTEMWYVLDNEPGARLVSGFNKEISKEEYVERVKNNTIEEVLASYPVKPGDAFFIPAGLVHAIGAGILLAEVQQTSNITYRIYDYNRKDKDGNTRQLHTQESVDAVDFKAMGAPVEHQQIRDGVEHITACEYFNVNSVDLTKAGVYGKEDFKDIESFVILMCLDGAAEVVYDGAAQAIAKGDTVLIPAAIKNSVEIKGGAKLLEAHI